MLKWIAARLDTMGASRKAKKVRTTWAARSRSDIRFVKADGVTFRYREAGEGRPIVFAADPPMTLEAYDHLLQIYSKDFRVIIFELPAMGFSVPGFWQDFRFFASNDSIAAFVDLVAREPAVLAFSCVAGLGALDIAGRYPALVSHLIQIQTPSWNEEIRWKKSRDPKNVLAKPILGQIAMRRLARSRAPRWLELAVGRKDCVPGFCACATEALDHGAAWAMATAFQNYLPEQEPSLMRVAKPTLAIWGNSDGSHLDTKRQSSLWLCDHPASHIVEHDGLGHFPEPEDVELIHSEIARFIANNPDP